MLTLSGMHEGEIEQRTLISCISSRYFNLKQGFVVDDLNHLFLSWQQHQVAPAMNPKVGVTIHLQK
jgi:hypothetical protein